MTKSKALLLTLIVAPFLSALAGQYVDVTTSGRLWECRVDGVIQLPRHSDDIQAGNRAGQLKLENPDSAVVCEQSRSIVATLTEAGRALIAAAMADSMVGSATSDLDVTTAQVLVNENFSSTPLSPQGSYVGDSVWYDGVDITLGTMPTGGDPAYEMTWPAGANASNGQVSPRITFPAQTAISVSFDFQATDMDDVAVGDHHYLYIRSTLDDIWEPPTDGFNVYLEPQANGEFYADLRRSTTPADWEELSPTSSVDVYDGTRHTVCAYFEANTFGNEDGSIRVKVDSTTIIDRDGDIEIFLNANQRFNQVSFGPYISGGPGSNVGDVYIHTASFKVESGDTCFGSAPSNNGVFNFVKASETLSVADDDKVVTIQRTGTDGAVTVDVDSSDGTATAGEDYVAVDETLSFPDGIATQTVTISTHPSISLSGTETFDLTLSSATGGASVGSNNTLEVSVLDTDQDYSWVGAAPAGSPVAGAYCVAPDGQGDNGNSGLCTESPWATIAYGLAQLSAGDTLYLRDGTHTPAGETNMKTGFSDGTSGNRIVVGSYPGERATIDCSNAGTMYRHDGKDYWTWKDLTFVNCRTALRFDDDLTSVGILVQNMRCIMNRGGDTTGCIHWQATGGTNNEGHVLENLWITGPGPGGGAISNNTATIMLTRAEGIIIRQAILHNAPLALYFKHANADNVTDSNFEYRDILEYDIWRSDQTQNYNGALIQNVIFGRNHPGVRMPENNGKTGGDYITFDHVTFYSGGLDLTDQQAGDNWPGGVDPRPGSRNNTVIDSLLNSCDTGTANNTFTYTNYRSGSACSGTGNTTGTPTYVGGDFTKPSAYALTGSVGVGTASDAGNMGADVSTVGPQQ